MNEKTSESGSLMIGAGVRFTGSIYAPNVVTVHGDISGELTAGRLHIGANGSVAGLVSARDIDVHGRLSEVTACDRLLRVHKTGVVTGTVEYCELEVVRGGECSGELNRRPT